MELRNRIFITMKYFPAGFLLIALSFFSAGSGASPLQKGKKQPPVGLFDLGYTLKADLNNPADLKMAWDDVHAVATLQGIVNREFPRLYIFFVVNKGINIDRYWWDKYRAKGEWLNGRDTVVYKSIVDLVNAYKKDIGGAVVYDPKVAATSNVASSIAGIEDVIAIRYDTTPNSLYSQLILHGPQLPVKVWLLHKDGSSLFTGTGNIPGTARPSSGSAKDDAYLWFLEQYMKKGKSNTRYGAYYIDQEWMKHPTAANRNHHTLANHDFFVSRKAFFFDLSPWGDEPATDDPHQQAGTDLNTLKELLLTAYKQNHGREMCYIGGFPPWAFKYTRHTGGHHQDVETEWEYTKIISAYNAFQDADAINYGALANASFWQHFPLKKKYPQQWVTKAALRKRGYLTADGKVRFNGRKFIIFYVGDYDASSWVSQTTPTIWDNPDRGKVPLMWCISPVLAERVPMALDYRRKTATKNDYFAAADNGAGYLMPGMLQAPRPVSGLPDGTAAWVDHNRPYYDRWGLSITGFIIDGNAPGLNQKGFDAYAKFSPDGIVPQKCPLTLLKGNMPVIRAGDDVNENDPAAAAKHIIESVGKQAVPFHWFRNILKSPTWYVQVVAALKRSDPKIELLDAPSFFELYRIYLQHHPDAAQGRTRTDQ